jgi:hypothetical protein
MEKTILKHGVEHISKLESTKINRTKTNLKKYGVQTPILLSENRNKSYKNRRDLFIDKYNKPIIFCVYFSLHPFKIHLFLVIWNYGKNS